MTPAEKRHRTGVDSKNLHAALRATREQFFPINFGCLVRRTRAHFGAGGDAAPQAGISQTIVLRHFWNLQPRVVGERFFEIAPDAGSGAGHFRHSKIKICRTVAQDHLSILLADRSRRLETP